MARRQGNGDYHGGSTITYAGHFATPDDDRGYVRAAGKGRTTKARKAALKRSDAARKRLGKSMTTAQAMEWVRKKRKRKKKAPGPTKA